MKYKSLYIVFASSLLILFVLVYQGTFAYFVANVTTESDEIGGTTLTAADLKDLVLVNGENTGDNLWIPGTSKTFDFTISNPSSVDLCVNLVWTDVTNTWINQTDLVYTLKGSDGNAVQDSTGKKIENIQFPSTTEEDQMIVGPINIPKGGTEQNYTLTVTYNETQENQNEDMGKSFTATVEGRLTECSTGGGVVDQPYQPFPDTVFANVDNPNEETGNGLYTVDHSQDKDTTLGDEWKENPELRYAGPDPDNYVTFNGENWRIIGLVNVKTTNNKIEQRLKIVKKDSIGEKAWDSGNDNDWSNASLQTYLNGTYYTNSINAIAQGMIATDIIWNLGGSSTYDDVTVSQFYERERGTTVYSNRPKEWNLGKQSIALPYPSDYGYATSGGSTGRTNCFAKGLYNWKNDYADCGNNDWLKPASGGMWTLLPHSSISSDVFFVRSVGFVGYGSAYDSRVVLPALYLSSKVSISGGTGTSSSPFQLMAG